MAWRRRHSSSEEDEVCLPRQGQELHYGLSDALHAHDKGALARLLRVHCDGGAWSRRANERSQPLVRPLKHLFMSVRKSVAEAKSCASSRERRPKSFLACQLLHASTDTDFPPDFEALAGAGTAASGTADAGAALRLGAMTMTGTTKRASIEDSILDCTYARFVVTHNQRFVGSLGRRSIVVERHRTHKRAAAQLQFRIHPPAR